MEEIASGCIFVSGLSGLFIRNKLRVRAHLGFDCFAVEQRTEFVEEYIVGRAVTNEMMHVAIEVQCRLGRNDSKAAEQVFGQIERPYKLSAIGVQFGFLERDMLDFQFLRKVDYLHNAGFVGLEMNE